jgi:hypothetical protein
VAAGLEAAPHRRQVGRAIVGRDHEVKDGAIVPECEPPPEVVVADVGNHPGHPVGFRKSLPGPFERRGGDFGDRDVGVALKSNARASPEAPPPTSTIGAPGGSPSASIIESEERGSGLETQCSLIALASGAEGAPAQYHAFTGHSKPLQGR